MIQLLSLRKFVDGNGVTKFTDKQHLNEMWRAPNIFELFREMEKYVAQIPEKERYNVYYTAANCVEGEGRIMIHQECVPFDIDGIDLSKEDEYINTVLDTLGLQLRDVGVVNSGNGLQFIVGLQYQINEAEMERLKPFYKEVCRKLEAALNYNGLIGKVDTSVFSRARLLRLAFTKNDKTEKGKGIKDAKLINGNITPLDFRLEDFSSQGNLGDGDTLNERFIKRLGPLDSATIQSECLFLRYCRENQAQVTEPQWYAMLSLIGRLKDGAKLAQEYSQGHPNYSYEETNMKLEQAINAAGPRTCQNIQTLFTGCVSCPHYCTELVSPVCLKGKHFVASLETGFWLHPLNGKGKAKPDYVGLVSYFNSQYPFVSLAQGRMIYVYKDNYWRHMPSIMIHNFVEENMHNPKPDTNICKEFENKLLRNNVIEPSFFEQTGYVNLQNGILNTTTFELKPHDKNLGMTSILPFAYDPEADCPRFKQFLREVTCEDKDLQAILEEYMGYSLSSISPEIGQKALILHGNGSNGKSVLSDTLCQLAGKNAYCALSIGHEISKAENRYQLVGKLFNISEETPNNALMDSSIFKALITGSHIQVRKLYHDSYYTKNKAKLIILCNELPDTTDFTSGMERRLLIVPFNASFTHEKGNMDVDLREKLYAEASGIFNLAMSGLKRFMVNKRFTSSAVSDEAKERFIKEGDVHSDWLRCNLVHCEGAKLTNTELMAKYNFDMQQLGTKSLGIIPMLRKARLIVPNNLFKRTHNERYIENYKLGDPNDTNRQEDF